ncbi:MAG: 1,4-dihydroxy-6-naphthoate synthase [Syntrophobacteraceae bacterium]|nr:1,4-dihydroxy-6-naphthoate synthase [Desulfobacteraceae bacterium]
MCRKPVTIRLGYSPCPNDTFIFFALAEGRIDAAPYRFETLLADVEALNQKARRGELDVTKVSAHAIAHLLDEYCLLRSGGAIGRGCGPLIVARDDFSMDDLRNKRMAIPGRLTTANLLLRIQGIHKGGSIEMPFDRIMDAVASGEVDAGVIIHEGRFTYPSRGLKLVCDLGEWWEGHTGLPLPLGGILVRRDLGGSAARTIEDGIRRSLLYAWNRPEEAWPCVRSHAQEMDPEVMRRHIDMFVNDFSADVGDEGERAIRYMVEAACGLDGLPLPQRPVFRDE